MGKFFCVRAFIAPILCLLASNLMAQGGFGGGGAGGIAGSADDLQRSQFDVFPLRTAGNINDLEPWTKREMILTPGDRVEWKIRGEQGKTMFAVATSDAFDPAISVVNEAGKVIAENDDQKEGDQVPFVRITFSDNKEYKLIVKNYRSNAGGKFALHTLTIGARAVDLGETNLDRELLTHLELGYKSYFRVQAKKGEVYSFSSARVGPQDVIHPIRIRYLVGPSGVPSQDFKIYDFGSQAIVFEALVDGEFLLGSDFGASAAEITETSRFRMRFTKAQIEQLHPNSSVAVKLPANASLVVKMKVDDFSLHKHTITSSKPIRNIFTAPAPSADKVAYAGSSTGTQSLSPIRGSGREVIRLVLNAGEAFYVIQSGSAEETSVNINSNFNIPELVRTAEVETHVARGQTAYHRIPVKRGDSISFTLDSDDVEPEIILMDSYGNVDTFSDYTRHQATVTLVSPWDQTYLVGIGSASGGGGGKVKLKYVKAEPIPYVLNSPRSAVNDNSALNVFACNLTGGQYYELVIEEKQAPVELVGSNLIPLRPLSEQSFGKTSMIYFFVDKAGKYVLRVGKTGSNTRFRLSEYTPPKLGGQ
jgi:hypothetical protein